MKIGDLDGNVRTDGCGRFTSISAAVSEGGVPRQRYRKELIRLGDYVMPSNNQQFTVDAALLDHWASTFTEMSKNGVGVPIPSTHAGAGDPDKNRGKVLSMFVEGESLVMTCELIGEDAIAAADRNDVSIHSPLELKDGKGNTYRQPITHVALTPEPLVPGLSAFVSIAASRTLECSRMNIKALGKLLGIDGDIDASNADAKLSSAIKSLQKKLAAAEKGKGIKASLETDPDPGDKDPPKDKDSPKPTPVLPMMLSLSRDNRTMKLDRLVELGRIDKSTHDKLVEQFATDGALTLVLSSSREDADGFDMLMETLQHNQPVNLGERTGPQTITLADGTKRSSDDVLLVDAEERAKAAAG